MTHNSRAWELLLALASAHASGSQLPVTPRGLIPPCPPAVGFPASFWGGGLLSAQDPAQSSVGAPRAGARVPGPCGSERVALNPTAAVGPGLACSRDMAARSTIPRPVSGGLAAPRGGKGPSGRFGGWERGPAETKPGRGATGIGDPPSPGGPQSREWGLRERPHPHPALTPRRADRRELWLSSRTAPQR